MYISVKCPHCGVMLEINSTRAHPNMKCPECAGLFDLPEKPIGVGDVVGSYQIKRLLGKGGMGQVYLANQTSMDRDVALKILNSKNFSNTKLIDRFINEVKLSARLEHPNIVRAYDAGEDDGIYYMAMAYVEGKALDEFLNDKPFEEAEALRIVKPIAQALKSAWEGHKMLHRDIKPGNIMIDKDGVPKLLDMGLSKSLDANKKGEAMTVVDMVIGTPNYMSPEQASSKNEIDTRADMYGLGTTLYHLLTGQLPFEGEGVVDILRKLATEHLPDPRTLDGINVSDFCIELLEIMMAKDPNQRHSTWTELIADIDLVLEGNPPSNHPTLTPGESIMLRARDSLELQRAGPPVLKVADEASGGLKPITWALFGGGAAILIMGTFAWVTRGPETPVVPPATTNSVQVTQGPSEEEQRIIRLERNLAQIETLLEETPLRSGVTLARLKALVLRSEGTDVHTKARLLLEKLEERLEADAEAREVERMAEQEAAEKAGRELMEKVDGFVLANDYQNAMALLKDYDGPYAEATKRVRDIRLTEIERILEKEEAEQEAMRQRSEEKLQFVKNDVISKLVAMEYQLAQTTFEESAKDEDLQSVVDEMNELEALIETAASLRDLLIDSLREDIGEVITLSVKGEIEEVRISNIDSEYGIHGKSLILYDGTVVATSPLDFELKDLSTKEMLSRLEPEPNPKMDLLRGLIAMRVEAYNSARRYFERSETMQAKMLLEQSVFEEAEFAP